MSRIFISHPYSANPGWCRSQVARIARRLALEQHLPIPPQLFLPVILDEATERELVVKICQELVALSEEVWVYGNPTAGMQREISLAQRLGIKIVRGRMP